MSKGRPEVNKDLPVNRDPAFTARLAEAVEDSGLDKNEIARLAGVKRAGTMSDWLAGQLPAGRALLRLPGILGVSGHWLLTGDGAKRLTPEEEADTLRLEAIGKVVNGTIDYETVRKLAATPPAKGDPRTDVVHGLARDR